MKILTQVATRPCIIRLSQIIPKIDASCQNILVHTGQNYDDNMSKVFFDEFKIRQPDYYLGVKGDLAEQISILNIGLRDVINKEQPDRILILGDTNSATSAFIAKRMGVKVYHMEAGNRSFDEFMPEEVNRRMIDHVSDVLMPYTRNSRENLLREGIKSDHIYVTGNPIYEVFKLHQETEILKQLDVHPKAYFLATAHRQENVGNIERMRNIILACSRANLEYKLPVIFSVHPNTAKKIEQSGVGVAGLNLHEPFGFRDFMTLEKHALCVITDSGTVQEECSLIGTPCVTIRDDTERPETIECGSNILSGVDTVDLLRCVGRALKNGTWKAPEEYQIENTSDIVTNIVVGY